MKQLSFFDHPALPEKDRHKFKPGRKSEDEENESDTMRAMEKARRPFWAVRKAYEELETPADIEHKTAPKGYPKKRGDYADPDRYKYPLDTEKHVRAALAYFGKPDNREGYDEDEQREIWRRIVRAAKHYKIEVNDEILEAAGMEKGARRFFLPRIFIGA